MDKFFIASASEIKIISATMTSTHCPAVCERPNHCEPAGKLTNSPCRNQRKPSRHVTIVASVTTMDGNPSPAMSAPLNAPMIAPKEIEATMTSASGQCIVASKPAQTLHTANIEPTEMSICRQMMTSAMPHATTSVGASCVASESSGCGW